MLILWEDSFCHILFRSARNCVFNREENDYEEEINCFTYLPGDGNDAGPGKLWWRRIQRRRRCQ